MPEGHTIHRLARTHQRLLRGHKVGVSSPQGRFTAGAALFDGQVLRRVEPYGKHLFYRFDGVAERLHVHLGLFGVFASGPLPTPVARGALRLRITGGQSFVDLRGPTACEVVTPAEHRAILARLGPDPLRAGADPSLAWARIERSRAPVGGLLMDQSVLAGIGNVYRAEILYRHGVAPLRPGRDLTREEWDAIWDDLRALMRTGTRTGVIVTTRPQDRTGARRSGSGTTVPREQRHYVYRRAGEPCRVCGAEVRSATLAARTAYWCPVEQAR